jgi:2-keto-myo-inositol isomerase
VEEYFVVSFGLNQIAVPSYGAEAFCALAQTLDCDGVEFRNDVIGSDFNTEQAKQFGGLARDNHLEIFNLSEVSQFDNWDDSKKREAESLIVLADAMGAKAIGLIPRNDDANLGKAARIDNLKKALVALQPMLAEKNLLGLIEPLGFPTASLRLKSEIVAVIEELGFEDNFKLIHDTFHHALAGEIDVFAQHTALVHISGVERQDVDFSDMQDQDRVLVGGQDRLGNISQISQLQAAGYKGPVSFEPFSPMVQNTNDIAGELAASIHFIDSQLKKCAA